MANAAVRINGAIDDVLTLQGIDVESRLTGNDLAILGLVLDIRLPELGLSTKLRVSGTIMDAKVGPANLALLEEGASALSTLVIGPLGLLAPFVHLGALNAHPCNIESIGELGLQSPAAK